MHNSKASTVCVLVGGNDESAVNVGDFLQDKGLSVKYTDNNPLNIQLQTIRLRPVAVFIFGSTSYCSQLCENLKSLDKAPMIIYISDSDSANDNQLGDMVIRNGDSLAMAYGKIAEKIPRRCRNAFLANNTDLSLSDESEYQDNSMDPDVVHQAVTSVLNRLCVTPNYHGYTYVREAIKLAMQYSSISMGVSKEIYPEIARRMSVTPSGVERNIRTAIHRAWPKVNPGVKTDIFGTPATNSDWIPTNSEFIFIVADRLFCQLHFTVG